MWNRRARRLLLAFSLVTGAQAGQDSADLLRLAQSKILDSLNRLPRYMCTQTIDRTMFAPDTRIAGSACTDGAVPSKTHPVTSDRLRLDVAKSDVEMYSWVGESHFNDHDIADIVREGAISNGSFVGFLTQIFSTDAADFTYNGEVTRDGRALSEFGFKVAPETSHYIFNNRNRRMTIGYEGSFLVDPVTADLVQLVVTSTSVPDQTTCSLSTTLDYERVNLQGIDFLLPSATLLRILNSDGSSSVNRTAFSGCHEFHGESTLSFDEPSQAPAGKVPAIVAPPEIPPGLPFRIALVQKIDTASAATGDVVKCKLVTPIGTGSKVTIPSGSAVGARIVRIRRFYGSAPYVALDLKLETVAAGSGPIPLISKPDLSSRFEQAKARELHQRVVLGTLSSIESHAAPFIFRTDRQQYVIDSGLESSWVTTER